MRTIIKQQGELRALFSNSQVISIDSETTGLEWDDTAFSYQLHDGNNTAYLNFNNNGQQTPRECLEDLKELCSDHTKLWVMANAKFDMRRLEQDGVTIAGNIWDVTIMERLIRNDHFKYSLDACLQRRGMEKDTTVETYIKKNKLFSHKLVPGKLKRVKIKHYDKVPFNIMFIYGCDDAEKTFKLYNLQKDELTDTVPQSLIQNDMDLVKAVYRMESRGVKISEGYCVAAMEFDSVRIKEIKEEISKLANREYRSGPLWLAEVMTEFGVVLEENEKGNFVLDKKALKGYNNDIANLILELRMLEKRVSSFWSSLIESTDKDGFIHANFKINGTDTGRFSCENPNLQQLPKKDTTGFPVRAAIIPRSSDYVLTSIDYSSMEYYLMTDLSSEMAMVKAIQEGMDPHTFVGNMMGAERGPAKTLNFMTLYGGGVPKLCIALFNPTLDQKTLQSIMAVHVYKFGKANDVAVCSQLSPEVLAHNLSELQKAKAMRDKYYEAIPNVALTINAIKRVAKDRGFVKSCYGRRYYFSKPEFAYAAPNHLVQGTAADVMRYALVGIDKLLLGTRSGIIATVHDEIVLEIHKEELHLVWKCKDIMEKSYAPYSGLFLKTEVDLHKTNWSQNDAVVIKTPEELYERVRESKT